MLNKILLLVLLVLLVLFFSMNKEIHANAAQPGIWNAGGMGNFSLLYPEDSLAYKKIQMVDEKVSVILYKGYAVVKGEYRMYNDTKDTIFIKTGYPLNSNFKSDTKDVHRAEIMFDSLYGLKVLVNSVPVNLISEISDNKAGSLHNSNWYVWKNIFAPEDTTLITVYFIVNTNGSIIREGYAKDENNGFIYILETGSTWKQPILKGEIKIKLEEGLTTEDIKGLKPDSVFKTDSKGNLLQYVFHNISPTEQDNVIITYNEKVDDLNFDKVLSQKETLFSKADEFSGLKINSEGLSSIKFNSPYEVESTDWPSLLLIFSIVGIPMLILAVITIAVIVFAVWLYKRYKKRTAV